MLFQQLKTTDKYMFLETLADKIASGGLPLAGQNPSIHFEYSVLQHPPVTVAVIWALSQTSPEIDAFQKVRSQFWKGGFI
jgi:hypothetical protein